MQIQLNTKKAVVIALWNKKIYEVYRKQISGEKRSVQCLVTTAGTTETHMESSFILDPYLTPTCQ